MSGSINDVVIAMRLEWVHAKASMERFEEEVAVLQAESERVGKSFRYYEQLWKAKAELWSRKGSGIIGEWENRLKRGAEAMAWKKMGDFERLAKAAEAKFAEVTLMCAQEEIN